MKVMLGGAHRIAIESTIMDYDRRIIPGLLIVQYMIARACVCSAAQQ
jgi:hypothetical protein